MANKVLILRWAGSAYELLIIPRQHDLHLQDASDDSLNGVGKALRDAGSLAVVDLAGFGGPAADSAP